MALERTLCTVRCEDKRSPLGYREVVVEAFRDPEVAGLCLAQTGDGWSVTHLETGYRLSSFHRRRKDAEPFLKLAATLRDWSRPLPKVGGKRFEALRNHVKALLHKE